MKKAWPAKNATSPGMKRFRGSINNTSPTRQNDRATTNHPRRPPETEWAAGMRTAAATRRARTAGLAAYWSRSLAVPTATQSARAATAAKAMRLQTAVTRWTISGHQPPRPGLIKNRLNAAGEGCTTAPTQTEEAVADTQVFHVGIVIL